jgi:ABC-type Fe3+-siderophore transport system permease subunit
VREQRICVFTPEQGDVLVRPGPRMAQAAQLMVQCLQGRLPGARAVSALAMRQPAAAGPAAARRQRGPVPGRRRRRQPGWEAVWGGAGDTSAAILWEIRLPRTLGAWLAGALLGPGGAVAQGLFRNPLAIPTCLAAPPARPSASPCCSC